MNQMKDKKNSAISKYKEIQRKKNILKQIQQLSWNITQFDRKFPFESISEAQYSDYIIMYENFIADLRKIFDDVLEMEAEKLEN